jgi:hypothetical protein
MRILIIPFLIFCFGFSKGYEEPWGKDSDLVSHPKASFPNNKTHLNPFYYLAVGMIKLHQTFISPMNQDRSNFRPTSSQYTMQAIQKYGFLKGFIMGCDRLMRENDEEWVYHKKEFNGILWKYDPID